MYNWVIINIVGGRQWTPKFFSSKSAVHGGPVHHSPPSTSYLRAPSLFFRSFGALRWSVRASACCQKAVFPQFSPSHLLQMYVNFQRYLPFSGRRRSLMRSGRGSCLRIIKISCRGWINHWWFLQRRSCFFDCVIPLSLMAAKWLVSLSVLTLL